MEHSEYPDLNQLFGVYLNQDFYIWGDTILPSLPATKEIARSLTIS
jgi:hypothetical protein